ncbi:MAG: ATP-binding cassette domain-containing protein [Candidatus Delongbacteria bacterium]|jgi:phospholipid/cholesterol/gamma-HCH transport system ATP-binding protein|nr:ATP-binding cassette domain-containing protein [Candidatus Delongbacteria bacterium]
MIKIENIHKQFSGEKVLNGITAEFSSGRINLVIGQSGSGKTVLLKSVLGLIKPDKGKIFFEEREFTTATQNHWRALRREMGVVFQGGALFTSKTVEDNVKFPLDMFTKDSVKEKKRRVDECLDRVGVKGTNKVLPGEISGGMQKRVAIARAIIMNPKFLFCDEPNSGLDPITSIRIDRLLKRLTIDYNITTVINTHDMNSVVEIGDYILFIHKGEKWWEGNKSEIFSAGNEEFNNFVFAAEATKKLIKT